MDTSETYIKMCEKADEIQEQRKVLAFVPNGSDTICWCGADTYSDGKSGAIWLPRQDQLQVESGLGWHDFDRKCLVYERVPTKEQAGIRVVMKEKYNKTWNGEEWIKS